MTVKEIIKQSAIFLNLEGVIKYLETGACENYLTALEEVKLLVDCYNVVTEEIASSHCRFKATETFSPKNNRVKLSEFSLNPLAIISVKNKQNSKINAKILPTEIANVSEQIIVDYYYIPTPKTIEDISDFTATQIKKRILVYGVITEYLLIKGSYEEASLWHDKYAQSLISIAGKGGRMRSRRWQ